MLTFLTRPTVEALGVVMTLGFPTLSLTLLFKTTCDFERGGPMLKKLRVHELLGLCCLRGVEANAEKK